MRFKACSLFDAGKPCGGEANMAKYLAAKASWEAANTCLQTHGGFGFARTNTTWSASSARRACTRWRRSPPT